MRRVSQWWHIDPPYRSTSCYLTLEYHVAGRGGWLFLDISNAREVVKDPPPYIKESQAVNVYFQHFDTCIARLSDRTAINRTVSTLKMEKIQSHEKSNWLFTWQLSLIQLWHSLTQETQCHELFPGQWWSKPDPQVATCALPRHKSATADEKPAWLCALVFEATSKVIS